MTKTEYKTSAMIKFINQAIPRSGFSKTEIAKRLGISKQHFSNILHGRSALSIHKAVELAFWIGLTEKDMITLSLQTKLDNAKLKYKVSLKK